MTEIEGHLTVELCSAILSKGELPESVPEHLLDHLLRRCPECLAAWKSYLEDEGLPGGKKLSAESWTKVDAALQHTLSQTTKIRQRIQVERQSVEKLLQELARLPDLAARVTRVRRSQRFRSWLLCERLLGRSQKLSFEQPAEAGECAELAIEATWALDDSDLGRPLISDLMARGWANLANARRLSGQPQLASEAFAMTRLFLGEGSGDPLVEAEVTGIAALIHRDLGQLEAAIQLHDRSTSIYEHLEIRAQNVHGLLQRSTTRIVARDLESALKDQRRALELVDKARNPRLWLCTEHLVISTLHKLGRSGEASTKLRNLQEGRSRTLDPWSRLRERQLEASLLQGSQSAQAEEAKGAIECLLAESGIFHQRMAPTRSLLTQLGE